MKNNWDYALEVQGKMNEICKPLEDANIKFAYDKIFPDYSILTLVSHDLKWLEFCKIIRSEELINRKASRLYLLAVLSTPAYQLGRFLWPAKILNDIDAELVEKFEVNAGISLFQKKQNSIECWCFITDNTYEQADLFLLKNIKFLKQFILHFNEQVQDLIDESIIKTLSLPHLPNELISSLLNQNTDLQYITDYKSLNHYKINLNGSFIILSKREVECLQNLALGKSIKEIANILEISQRTVEAHLNKIKLKSRIYTRSQLISLFLKSDINIIK